MITGPLKDIPPDHGWQPSADEVAFRKMKPEIDAQYPKGHYFAFQNGRIIADAPTYESLSEQLEKVSPSPREAMVVRAGGYYPEFAYILAIGAM